MAPAVPNFFLTPHQQSLLFAALNANRAPDATADPSLTMAPATLTADALAANEPTDVTGTNLISSPFLDYDYSFEGDNSLDYSLNDADGLPDITSNDSTRTDSNADNDTPDKRSHPDDEEDDATTKRREAGDRVPKKPGRKPLTSEPTSKRKAQNRAAQRAFRERKEKHLKDLETKIAELEKASESANNENTQLRTKLDTMAAELAQYKKHVAILTNSRPPQPPTTASQLYIPPMFNPLHDVDFHFEFPKYNPRAVLPPSNNSSNASSASSNVRTPSLDTTTSPSNVSNQAPSTAATSSGQSSSQSSPADSTNSGQQKMTAKDRTAKPANSSSFNPLMSNSGGNASRTSMDSISIHSPESLHSAGGPSSSCGTSPEPCNQSPVGSKPMDTLTTIEEQPSMFSNIALTTGSGQDISPLPNVDICDMNWLGPQANFSFDPQLFGDYREPQENILAAGFDDFFGNEVLDVDFVTPFNTAPTPSSARKGNLIDQIDAAKDGEFASSSVDPAANAQANSNKRAELLTCNKIWERLQNCDKVQVGEFDLDGLCQDLQKKAKCSGQGAVIDEADFTSVMKKYLSGDDTSLQTVGSAASATKV